MSFEALDLLAAPFLACLVLTGIHCYLGIHVVERGVIFVDLALAQIAALGTTCALLLGHDIHAPQAYYLALLFTFLGAAVFSLARFRDERVPQEAIIGIAYAVSSALAILVLDRAPHGHEEIKAMLVGSILFVTVADVVKITVIYAAVGMFHYAFRHRFLLISQDVAEARRRGWSIRLWDFLFYATFGVVVTSSVQIAGVLLVFSYLVVPTVCAMLFAARVRSRLLLGWGIGFVASVLGLLLSLELDLPTGASVVAMFGAVLLGCAGLYALGVARLPPRPPDTRAATAARSRTSSA
jgi:zinc/manganese transport system permease protein